jgi:hypothetical protein
MAWWRRNETTRLRDENADMRDALDHIMRVCRQSRQQSRRIRWIYERARCGLNGTREWTHLDLPKNVDSDSKRLRRLQAQLKEQER